MYYVLWIIKHLVLKSKYKKNLAKIICNYLHHLRYGARRPKTARTLKKRVRFSLFRKLQTYNSKSFLEPAPVSGVKFRVARFFLVKHTNTGKIDMHTIHDHNINQMSLKYTKCPLNTFQITKHKVPIPTFSTSRPSIIYPKFGILVWKYVNHLATLLLCNGIVSGVEKLASNLWSAISSLKWRKTLFWLRHFGKRVRHFRRSSE
jgi:hypothetical protein